MMYRRAGAQGSGDSEMQHPVQHVKHDMASSGDARHKVNIGGWGGQNIFDT